MSQTTKKILKYIVIVALLGGAVFLGVKFLFPAPLPTEVYQQTYEVIENKEILNLQQTNFQLLEAYQKAFGESENLQKHKNNHTTLSSAYTLMQSQLTILHFAIEDLAFAQNSAVYDVNAKEIRNISKDLNQVLQETESYISTNVTPVLSQDNVSEAVLSSIFTNMLNNSKQVTSHLTKYVDCVKQIFFDLKQNYTVNPYGKTLLQIANVWQQTQSQLLVQTETETFENFDRMNQSTQMLNNFVQEKLNTEQALEYLYNPTEMSTFVSSVSKANYAQLFLALTEQENTQEYINNIENLEIKLSTQNLYDFVTGAVEEDKGA